MAEQDPQHQTPPARTCGWCPNAATDDLIISAGRSRRRTAPVCRSCASRFQERGIITVKRETDLKYGGSSR